MTGIVEFVAARLDEDENCALAASFRAAHPGGNHWQWGEIEPTSEPPIKNSFFLQGDGGRSHTVSLITVETYNVMGASAPIPNEVLYSAGRVRWQAAEHIARHDPARVLAEVKAKRALLAQAAEMREVASATEAWSLNDYADGIERNLAAPYATHPDYNPAWSPA